MQSRVVLFRGKVSRRRVFVGYRYEHQLNVSSPWECSETYRQEVADTPASESWLKAKAKELIEITEPNLVKTWNRSMPKWLLPSPERKPVVARDGK